MINKPVLLLTGGDPWGAPMGGQTTFAKHLLTAFGARLAVCSYCNDNAVPVGKWAQRIYNDSPVWFLSRGSNQRRKDRKPLVPARIQAYFKARQFMPQVRQKEFSGLLIDSPEMLFAASRFRWPSVCYRFAGVNNPVANSRYPWARFLGGFFEKYHIASLNRIEPEIIIAAADHAAIDEFHHRTGNVLDLSRFHQFPTRVDTNVFFPMGIEKAREGLELPLDAQIFVATGRLCWIKGWRLLLKAFERIKQQHPNAILIFVGDGEDRAKAETLAKVLGVENNVRITGFQPQSAVAQYMNAADVCLVGSHREGWSLAMCEMIACGKAVVSTDVSGARDMILDGKNGFVISGRDPNAYADSVYKTMHLDNAAICSLRLSEKYSLKTLPKELGAIWEPLRPE